MGDKFGEFLRPVNTRSDAFIKRGRRRTGKNIRAMSKRRLKGKKKHSWYVRLFVDRRLTGNQNCLTLSTHLREASGRRSQKKTQRERKDRWQRRPCRGDWRGRRRRVLLGPRRSEQGTDDPFNDALGGSVGSEECVAQVSAKVKSAHMVVQREGKKEGPPSYGSEYNSHLGETRPKKTYVLSKWHYWRCGKRRGTGANTMKSSWTARSSVGFSGEQPRG